MDLPYDENSYNKLIYSWFMAIAIGTGMGYFISDDVSSIVKLIAQERENGTKDLMSFLGLNLFQFWSSQLFTWFYQQALPIVVNTICLIVIMNRVDSKLDMGYDAGNYMFLLFSYWCAVLNFALFGFAISSLIHNAPVLDIFKFSSAWFMTLISPVILILTLNEEPTVARVLLQWIPQCNFCFSMRDAFGSEIHPDTVLFNIMNACIWGTLTFYLDMVVPTSKGGASRRCCFCCSKRHKHAVQGTPSGLEMGEFVPSKARDDVPVLELDELVKTYGEFTAVNNLNLRLQNNQVFGLLGFNGAGKTTTIEMITGQQAPSSGLVKILGVELSSHIESLRRVMGVCPQKNILWPGLSLYEHLVLFGRLRGIPESEIMSESERLMKTLDLTHVKDTLADKLSGGQKRKLMCLAAFMGDPRFILLDEPTAGVDIDSREKIHELIQQNKKDKLILLTTHHMEEADTLCDYISIMGSGQILIEGTPVELKVQHGGETFFSVPVDKIPDEGELGNYFVERENGQYYVHPIEDQKNTDIVRHLEKLAGDAVKVENSSLENVFLKLAKKEGKRRDTVRRDSLTNLMVSKEDNLFDMEGFSRPGICGQFFLLMHKRLLSFYKSPYAFIVSIVLMMLMSLVAQMSYLMFGVRGAPKEFLSLDDIGDIPVVGGTLPDWVQYPSNLTPSKQWSDFTPKKKTTDWPEVGMFYVEGDFVLLLLDRFNFGSAIPILTGLYTGVTINVLEASDISLAKLVEVILAAQVFSIASAFMMTTLHGWTHREKKSGMYELQILSGVSGTLIWCVNFLLDYAQAIVCILCFSAAVFPERVDFEHSMRAASACLVGYIPFVQCFARLVPAESLQKYFVSWSIVVQIIIFMMLLTMDRFIEQLTDGGAVIESSDSEQGQPWAFVYVMRFIMMMCPPFQYFLTQICLAFDEYTAASGFKNSWYDRHWTYCFLANAFWIVLHFLLEIRCRGDPSSDKPLPKQQEIDPDENSGMVAKGMVKVFKDKTGKPLVAVNGVAFDVKKGTCYGLLGTNGAGKSTMMKMMSTYLKPSGGEGKVFDNDIVSQRSAIRRVLGICNQHDVFCPHYTGREHLYFFAQLKGVPRGRVAGLVDELALRLKFHEHLDTKCENMSGGNKRKVNLAAAVLGLSEVVLLDEPSASVDPFARDCMKTVLHAFKQGRCLLFTSHNLEEANLLCDEVGVMHRGELVLSGAADELLREHANLFHLSIGVSHFAPQSVADLKNVLSSEVPGIREKEDAAQQSTLEYVVPRSVGLSRLFQVTDSIKIQFKCDLLVESPSMKDLFLKATGKDREENAAEASGPDGVPTIKV